MGNLSFERQGGGKEAEWLVIPCDGYVQFAARPIVGHASISIRGIPPLSFRGARRREPGIQRLYDRDSGFASEPVSGPRFARTRWTRPGMAEEASRLHQSRARPAGGGILVAVGQRQIGF